MGIDSTDNFQKKRREMLTPPTQEEIDKIRDVFFRLGTNATPEDFMKSEKNKVRAQESANADFYDALPPDIDVPTYNKVMQFITGKKFGERMNEYQPSDLNYAPHRKPLDRKSAQ